MLVTSISRLNRDRTRSCCTHNFSWDRTWKISYHPSKCNNSHCCLV